MVIGPVGLLVGVVLAELLALVQAASTLTPSITAAPAANRDLTPMVIPAETASCRVKPISGPGYSVARGAQCPDLAGQPALRGLEADRDIADVVRGHTRDVAQHDVAEL